MNQESITVSELTKTIKNSLENHPGLNQVWVSGEISNLTYHSSGHIYFTLKDENAVISATFFKYSNNKISFRLQEGMAVLALGSVSVFEKRGSYQLNIHTVKPAGIGELQKKIDALKKKLLDEGLFHASLKRPLPLLPRKIGIVTSPTGAAVQDILKVALRRYPTINILIAPAKVQGGDAVASIVAAIAELNRPEHEVDVIIAGRGGGSFEDLMPFNEEPVVRAYRGSRVPIVSAVGHQIDHPLCDDAADLFAATPSHAAELVVPDKKELIGEIEYLRNRIDRSIGVKIRETTARVRALAQKTVFQNPRRVIEMRELWLQDIEQRCIIAARTLVTQKKDDLRFSDSLQHYVKQIIEKKRYHYELMIQALDKLSPLNLMKRGFLIARNQNQTIIKSIREISRGNIFSLQFIDGVVKCSADEIIRRIPGATEKNH